MQLLLFATTTAYVLATFFRIKEKVADCSLKSHSALSLFIGVACNSIMAFKIFTDGNSGFHYQTFFVIGALSLGICTIFIEKGLQESFFSIFTVPASIVFLFCSTFADGTLTGDHFTHKWFAIHLLLAILGECFFFIAAISSLTYLFVVRRLKKKNRLRAVFFFPPLARLDDLTFKLITVGTITFFCGLTVGLYGNFSHFSNFAPGSKHIFSLLLFIFYMFVILARKPLKLTGSRMATLAIAGFFLSLGLITLPETSEHWKPLLTPISEAIK